MEHYLHPRYRAPLRGNLAQGYARARNCADVVTVEVELATDTIRAARFSGSGCAIFTAATDLLLDAMINKTRAEAAALLTSYETMLATGAPVALLGALNAFSNVKRHLNRLDCALVPVRALRAALTL